MASAIDTGISAKHRSAIANGLSRLLADTYVLYLKTHGFHWNVEGPMFQTLHIMFMDLTQAPAVDRPVKTKLRFERAGEIEIELGVTAVGAGSGDAGGHKH